MDDAIFITKSDFTAALSRTIIEVGREEFMKEDPDLSTMLNLAFIAFGTHLGKVLFERSEMDE